MQTKTNKLVIPLCAVLTAAVLFCSGAVLFSGEHGLFSVLGVILSAAAAVLGLLYFCCGRRHVWHRWLEIFHILGSACALLAALSGSALQLAINAALLAIVLVLGLVHFVKPALPLVLCGGLLMLDLLVFFLELGEGTGFIGLCHPLGELFLTLILTLCVAAAHKTAPIYPSETEKECCFMELKKYIHGTPMAVSLILILVSILLCVAVFVLAFNDLFSLAGACISLAALLSALLYIFRGGTKHAAKYFMTFKILFCLSGLALAVQAILLHNPLTSILCLLCLAMLLVLTVTKDLGQSLSINFCALIGALKLILIVLSLCPVPGVQDGDAVGLVPFLRSFAELSMAVTLFACTFVKFKDKKARGRAV